LILNKIAYTPPVILKLPLVKRHVFSYYSNLKRGVYIKLNRLGLGKERLHFLYIEGIISLYFKKSKAFLIALKKINYAVKNLLLQFLTFFIPVKQELLLKGYGLEFFIYNSTWLELRTHRRSKTGLHFIKIPKNVKIQFLETSETFRKTKMRLCGYNVGVLNWFINRIRIIKTPEVYTGTGIFFSTEVFKKRVGKSASFV
jgi:hypothetical protein